MKTSPLFGSFGGGGMYRPSHQTFNRERIPMTACCHTGRDVFGPPPTRRKKVA
jgi:hypothetical protein